MVFVVSEKLDGNILCNKPNYGCLLSHFLNEQRFLHIDRFLALLVGSLNIYIFSPMEFFLVGAYKG